ncbi:uncharacterized protein V6R79_024710 [Siganus canaliculatus]
MIPLAEVVPALVRFLEGNTTPRRQDDLRRVTMLMFLDSETKGDSPADVVVAAATTFSFSVEGRGERHGKEFCRQRSEQMKNV